MDSGDAVWAQGAGVWMRMANDKRQKANDKRQDTKTQQQKLWNIIIIFIHAQSVSDLQLAPKRTPFWWAQDFSSQLQ